MWNRFNGKPKDPKDELPSQMSRRNDDEERYYDSRVDSIASSKLGNKSSTRPDDRDSRGSNPTSTSHSYTTQGQRPGAASASIASSPATASGNDTNETHVRPGLARNASLADQMPRSSASRSSRDPEETRKIRDKTRDKTERSDGRDRNVERRQKRDQGDKKDNGSRRLKKGLAEEEGARRGAAFPGQYDRATSGLNNVTPEHPAMSSHVQDQFPGQFPTQSSAPYRPPLAASEGGPGLAAEYYGDDGQSVVEQPGNRIDTPSLIIGAEPHLQPALAVAAPPPEPSASGIIGAAASFFNGEVEEVEAASTHSQYNSFSHSTNQIRPNSNHHSSSAPVVPIIGGTGVGSAIGNYNGSQNSSHQQHQDHEVSIGGAPSVYSTTTTTRPPSQAQGSYHSSISRPPKPGKHQSQSSGIPISTVGIAGAVGLAAGAYEHNHHSSLQDPSSMSQNSTTSMAQRYRNHGPFSALMNFFKDPEGVAQFEEYSEIIGVCRHCFAPGSSPRDAPRKHLHKRRSGERYGSSARVDKDSRYYSSENEKRRKNRSWLTTGLGGYGLAKVGQNLSSEKNDLGDTYSEKTGSFSPEERNRRARRRSRSKERVEIGTIDYGKSDRKGPRDETSTGTKRMASSARRHSRTRPRSKVRTTGLGESAIDAALESSVVASSSQRRSRSPKGTHGKGKHKSPVISPDRLHKTKHKKRDRGLFGFGNGSSSSSSSDLAYTRSQDKHRSSTKSHGKSKDDKKAEAALLGLGAATAALALSDGRQGHRRKGVRELVGVKETKGHDGHGSGSARRSKKSSEQQDDELWESAAEDDYESVNSELAYGAPGRRDSRASLSSESSGTNKWGWRWGKKRNPRASTPRRDSSDYDSFPAVAGAGLIGSATIAQDQHQGNVMDSTGGLPLQHVYPVPTSDPSRFDVGRGDPIVSPSRPIMSSRPEAVPLQHPRPVAPVSAAIYSSQTPYDHSFSAPTGPAMFSQTQYQHHPETSDARQNTNEASMPGSFPRLVQQADDAIHDFRLRRRDTSPARIGQDSTSNSIPRERRASTKVDSSAVRFDLTEEQEERDRRERRRKRKEDKDRREAKEQEKIESDRRASREQSRKKTGPRIKTDEAPGGSSETSWVGPAAAGIIGATIGVAAATDKSRSEEMREKRRQRRQKERELEDEEDALSKSERRRMQKEQHDQDAAIKDSRRLPDEASTSYQYADHKKRSPEKQEMSVWQEAASTKQTTSHEDYRSFFTPIEVLNKSSDQVKITSANADADIDLDPVPRIVTVKPKRVLDLSDSPALSLADTDDRIDPSKVSFPWQIPKLRLEEPTPPSTRGSTPIAQSRSANDNGFEGPREGSSSAKVKWEDEQTPEYTVIAPKEDPIESIESVSREINDTDAVDSSESSHERDLPVKETHPRIGSTTEKSPAPYGEDAEFAATLAASAEDAGFDPSIVINNPTYRRRDSPPGSNERNMPGGFDDENEQRRNKKEQKEIKKSSRRQRQSDDSRQRDDDAVQNIISQTEEIEYQPSHQVPSDNHNDDLEDEKKTDSNKSKDGRKGSNPKVHSFEASEVGRQPPASESGDVLGPTTEDIQSVTSSSPDNDEADSDAQIRKKSKNDSTRLDLATATVPHPSKTEVTGEPKSKPKDKRKGSVWDRILGKSTGSLPQDNGAEGLADKAISEDPDISNNIQKTRKGKSSRDGNNERDTKERSSIQDTTSQVSDRSSQVPRSKDRGSSKPPVFSDAGSVSQYLVHDLESEQIEEKQPEPFLGMRPEPPPPPDTRAESEGLSSPLEAASLPTTPRAEFDAQSRRSSDAEISDPSQTTAGLPSSPTAIPFHFRRPGRSSGTARSLPQTPIPSDKSAVDLSPKQKPRPRSTEFKSSKEIRPLWLVERHRSHQEPRPDEVYPSLPSSHTTSRSSSVHDVEEGEPHERDKRESNEELEPIEAESAPMISTVSNPIQQSDVLDSQQATPTASSFQDPKNIQIVPSLPANRDSSSEVTAEEASHKAFSTVKSGVLHAILGGSTARALNGAIQSKDLTRSDQSQEKNDDFEHGSDDMAVDAATSPQYNDTVDHQEDFVLQKTKKGKKNKRNPGQPVRSSITRAVETPPSTISLDPEPLSPETMRQIQERDAQDAVDSWSSVAMPSNEDKKGKKGKKGKGKALVERSPEESAPSPNTYQPPRDTPEITMPAEGQEVDTLTTGMSREQIVDVMTTAANGADKKENKKSQSATAVNPEPLEIQEEEDPSVLIGRNDEKSRKVLLHDEFSRDVSQARTLPQTGFSEEDLHQDDILQGNLTQHDLQEKSLPRQDLPRDQLPSLENHQETYPEGGFSQLSPSRDDFPHSQDPQNERLEGEHRPESLPVLSSSSPATVTFISPFSEKAPGDVPESPNANPASREELDRGDLPTVMLPPLELSPRATPLPDSEDHDLLEEQAGISGPTSGTYADYKDMDIAAAETPSDIPYVANTSAITLEQQQKSQDRPSQADQVDDGEDYAVPYKNKSKKSKVKQSSLDEDLETPGSQEEEHAPLSNVITTTAIGNDLSKGLNDDPPIETPQKTPKVTEGECADFTSNKRGKKAKNAKKGFSSEKGKAIEVEEGQDSLPEVVVSEAPENPEAMKTTYQSAVVASQPEALSIEHESLSSNGKKNGKKRKKNKPSVSVEGENTLSIGDEKEILSRVAPTQTPGYDEATELIDDSATRAPKSEVTEESTDFIDELTNQVQEPEVVHDEFVGPNSEIRGENLKEQSSETASEAPVPDETEHQFQRQTGARNDMNDQSSSSATTRTSQDVGAMLGLGEIEASHESDIFPVEVQAVRTFQKPYDQIPSNDERSLPVLYDPEISPFQDALRKAHDDEMHPARDTSVASTNTAQGVQNMLAGESNAESAMNAKREVMVASAGMEETPFTVGRSEGNEVGWTAPKKKKKGKKGGKFDAQSLNKPETIDPTETSGPLRATDTLLEERPTADPTMEENELDRDAQKKKKKGKKGKKSEELVLDEPEIMNPVESLSAPIASNRPPLEQPTAETIDEAFTKQSKKDKKNKKGKRKGVLRAVSDFRDEDEPDSVPPELSQDGKRMNDLATSVHYLQEEAEGNVLLTEAAQDDTRFEDDQATTRDSRNEVEPSVIPTELLQDDDQTEDRSAEDHLSVTSDIRDDPEPKTISTEAPGNDKVPNFPANSLTSIRAEDQAPDEGLKPVVLTELVQADATKRSREVPMEEEHYFVPPRGKRDEKKSRESEKPSVFLLDENEIPALGDDEHLAETYGLRKEGIEQAVPSSNVGIGGEPEETAQRIQSDSIQDLGPPKTKKDKKKSKNSKTRNAVPPKCDFSPVLETVPISKPEDNEGDAPEQTRPSSLEVFKEPEQSVESLPEEKKGQEETEAAQPFGWENAKVTPQAEKDAAQRLDKDSDTDGIIYPSNAVGNAVMVQGKREEHGHEYIDPVSAYAAASEVPHETASPRTSSLEEAPGDQGETTPLRLNTSQSNIIPPVELRTNPLYALEPSKEDNKEFSISRQLTREDESSQDRRDVLKGSYATEDPSNPSTIPVSQHAESWSKPEISAQEIEPTDIVQPGMESEEDQVYQGNVFVDPSSQSRDQIRAMVEVEHDKKSQETKSEKLSITQPEEAQYPADEVEPELATGISRMQTSEQASEHPLGIDVNTTGEMRFNQKDSPGGLAKEVNMEAVAVDEAKEEDLVGDTGSPRAEKSEEHPDQGQLDESKIEDSSPSASNEPARKTVETFQNAEYVPDIKSIPALDVEMLDAQEQRDYNDEYAKELERQLISSQDGNQIDPLVDQADVPMFTQSSMNRPLAQPPALEDIIEESRSSPGPIQASPPNRQDDFSTFKSGKKGKKGKKSKKQQPIIWEDETATPSLEPESDQVAKPITKSSEGPGSWDTDAAEPFDLDESIDQQSLEDRRTASPHGDFNIAFHERLLENDRADDYFTIQPSKPAEEDVGREGNPVLWAEPPYSSRDRSPGQEPQTDPGVLAEDDPAKDSHQHEELASHATDLHHQIRTEVDPAEENVEDILDPAPVENTEEDTLAKQNNPAKELSPQALGQEDFMNQPKGSEIPIENTPNELSPSRQHSLQRFSHEDSPEWSAHDEPPLVAKSRSASRDRSESRGRSAAAVYLSELAAETISRRDSKKQGKRDKKAKKAGRRTELEAEIGEAENHLDRGQLAVEEQEHGRIPEPESAIGSRQHHRTTATRSPPSASYEAIQEHPVVGDLDQLSEKPGYRDSAIHVSNSPEVSEEIPYHRTARDSGYPDTETSPTFDDGPGSLEEPAELNRRLDSDESVGHLQHRHNYGPETDERQNSTSRDTLEIPIEASADYDVSVSRPKEKRNRSRRKSGAAYDSDDSADSGFDIQRRRRQQAMAAEPREPSPVSSTTKDRSSALFDSSPSAREETVAKSNDQDVSSRHDPIGKEPTRSVDREILPQQQSREASRGGRSDSVSEHAPESKGHGISTGDQEDTESSLFGGPRSYEDDLLSRSRSPPLKESRGRRRRNSISEHDADGSALHEKDKRAMSDVGSPESDVKGRRTRSAPLEDDEAGGYVASHQPISVADEEQEGGVEERNRSLNSDELSTLSGHHSGLAGVRPTHRDDDYRTRSAASVHSETENSIYAIIRTPDQIRSASGLSYRSSATPTPPLRRVDRSASGDLRGRAKRNKISSEELQLGPDPDLLPSSSTHDPITDKATSTVDMANVYEGWGDVRGQSPMSPTRPPSMRKRQSMQLLDLETRLDQIVSENRLLASQKLTAERALEDLARDHSQERHAYEEAMQEHKIYLERKESELGELKQIIEHLHDQAAHLTEVNEGLAASQGANEEHEQRYAQLSAEHAHTHEQWQQSAKDLEDLREQHTQLSTGMEDIVRHEVNAALDEKNLELRRLQSELENAKQQVRNLQQQLLASRNSDSFVERDEDYFDSQCQSLCQHVQQWVLRFSKFSDMKACYLASAIKDEKVVDRMENAILDGTDVDDYLSDRVKRRDVFMSVVMTMIWEFIFTRYLFGMDREQRQKLKNLEKTLQGVGPIGAVHKWRATTLSLLMKREAFENQRATDTEAVVHEIYDTLATFLPPPSHLVGQIQDSLRKVIDTAVDLSIEMRTQRAEYTMLPPLQPEYDTNGDLARKVYFSALTMNERSGATSSNEALQEQHAVVRMVLFPLVVKNEDDDEQIVVCPAQVLTAEGSKGKKTVRVLSAQGGRSEASFAGSDVRMEGGMI